ncbi:MAG: hypothetical protein Q9183_007883, partial [Haloplaca sp. 2 TL-2023]
MSSIPKIHIPDPMGVDNSAASSPKEKDEVKQQEPMPTIPEIHVSDTIGDNKRATSPSYEKDEAKQQKPDPFFRPK